MTERPPHDLAFDPATVADALGAPMVERLHQAFGRGFRYALGIEGYDDPTADLEIYPAAEVVRYASKTASVALRFQERQPLVTEECVVFESRTDAEQSSLVFTRDGSVTFFQAPASPKSEAQREWETAAREVRSFTNQVEQGAGELAASRENPSLERNGEQEKTRVKLEGRLGQGVRVSQSSRGVRANFELYEDTDDGEVRHDVYSTKDYAARIRDGQFQSGEEVRVVGSRQQHPIPNKTGELETKEVIYAYAVKRLAEPNGG